MYRALVGIKSGHPIHQFRDNIAKQTDRKQINRLLFSVIKHAALHIQLIQKLFFSTVETVNELLAEDLIVQLSSIWIPLQA